MNLKNHKTIYKATLTVTVKFAAYLPFNYSKVKTINVKIASKNMPA